VFPNIEELYEPLEEFRERSTSAGFVQRRARLTHAQARHELIALGAAA